MTWPFLRVTLDGASCSTQPSQPHASTGAERAPLPRRELCCTSARSADEREASGRRGKDDLAVLAREYGLRVMQHAAIAAARERGSVSQPTAAARAVLHVGNILALAILVCF